MNDVLKARGENDVKFTNKIVEDVFIRTVKSYWNYFTIFCITKCGTFSISDFEFLKKVDSSRFHDLLYG